MAERLRLAGGILALVLRRSSVKLK
ncbi:hypothetical protein CCACVL1_09257 [Corchorus capsularis]|uniref:Uncharacterized protein n=1 Tax=Corchorus capsularis TaxID=210143 RepID=A0A1R3IX19_COCAP|nr:hypothetical protein CCACVL1_09257 [Corchorus capsularis]